MTRHERIDGKTRVARHRAAMRAQGYRLRQMWVPDTRLATFRAEIAREVAAINALPHDEELWAFIEAARHMPPDDPIEAGRRRHSGGG